MSNVYRMILHTIPIADMLSVMDAYFVISQRSCDIVVCSMVKLF